jgi:hypothetical protein
VLRSLSQLVLRVKLLLSSYRIIWCPIQGLLDHMPAFALFHLDSRLDYNCLYCSELRVSSFIGAFSGFTSKSQSLGSFDRA